VAEGVCSVGLLAPRSEGAGEESRLYGGCGCPVVVKEDLDRG
jgi:hypothetical protein